MDTMSNFLISLKNAYKARKKSMVFTYSNMIFAVGKLLEEKGYISKIEKKEVGGKSLVELKLLYKDRKAAFRDVKIISKPSVHIYADKNHIPSARGGFGITILSTSQGIMTGKQAQKENVGGEVICQIY